MTCGDFLRLKYEIVLVILGVLAYSYGKNFKTPDGVQVHVDPVRLYIVRSTTS
jgi:hypothetical protein